MAEVSQGRVYGCDFGLEGGVDLADRRLALVVRREDCNREKFEPVYLWFGGTLAGMAGLFFLMKGIYSLESVVWE